MVKEYDDMKEEIQDLKTESGYRKFYSVYKTILLYCLKCRKNKKSKNPKVVKTKNQKIMLLSKCELCHSKKLKFSKDLEASRFLSRLEIKTTLSKVPLVDPILF